MSFARQHLLKLLISLALALGFVWLLNQGALPWLPAKQALDASAAWALPAYLGIWSVVHLIRAARWQLLLRPFATVDLRRVLAISFIGFAAIVVLPMRTGEVVRPALLRQRNEVSGWSVLGTIGAERIIDGLVLSLMLLLGLTASSTLSPLPTHIGNLAISPAFVPRAAGFALIIFGAAFVAMALFYFARGWARRWVEACVGLVSRDLAQWLAERIEKVTEGLSFLPRPRVTLAFITSTVAYWFLNAAATQVLAHSVGLSAMTYSQACVLTGVLALGIMVPNAPGFFGAFQFSVYAALSLFFREGELLGAGSVLVFYLYVGQMLITLAGAVLGALALKTSLVRAITSNDNGAEVA